MTCPFEDVKNEIKISYTGEGRRIAREFYIPLLKRAKLYDRASGYFSVDSMVITAAGLAGLITNGGRMRLVLGAHDLGPDIIKVMELSKHDAEGALKNISERIAKGLETVESIFEKRRLEALAWMLANNTLEIRVALPKRTFSGLGNGIFHEKRLLIKDEDGCIVQAAGSVNETRMAYELNGENLTVHMSWRPGALEYVADAEKSFEVLWDGSHPDYYTFTLPEAISRKLHERFYIQKRKPLEPLELEGEEKLPVAFIEKCTRLTPIAKLVSVLGCTEGLAHLGLGPIRLYPHQAFTADYVLSRFPHRVLLADEVGLGKTLEAGAAIRRMVDAKEVKRVLILAPKNVTRQWMEEMWDHFRLRFWMLTTNPRQLIDPLDNKERLHPHESPFSKPGIDFIVASWHYVRRDDAKQMLLSAERGFDLVVIDEAHAARKKRSITEGKVQPTKMNELCMEISVSTPHMLLLTATPVQLRAIESHDLLRVLGLGGRWAVEQEFEAYFTVMKKPPEECEEKELLRCFKLAAEFVKNHLPDDVWKGLVERTISSERSSKVIRAIVTGTGEQTVVNECMRKEVENLHKLLMEFNPVQWFMVRNTRSKLEEAGFRFPQRLVEEQDVKLDDEHAELLGMLDNYIRHEYAAYERLLSPENRGVIGFVRTIYHQRFVSCFTAAYQTLRNRKEFISGLLSNNKEALLRAAAKLLEDEDLEEDEDDIVDAIQELLDDPDAQDALRIEEGIIDDMLDRLRPFAPGHISGNDPKLNAVISEIRKLTNREGRSVLVFSKYADTVDAIREFILSHGVDRRDIALYTGDGGQLLNGQGEFEFVSKDRVQKALAEGVVSIVLCTDAASEGLNLQAASAIINVDMPWNPARVEQRIGRVDRLGQKADDVKVVNIWYPNTIEAKMYKMLFERRQIYKLVVGPAQEIFSTGLRRAFDDSADGERLDRIVTDTFRQINDVKEDLQRTQGVLSGHFWEAQDVLDSRVVDLVMLFIEKACGVLGLECKKQNNRLYVNDGKIQIPEDIKQWNGAYLEMGAPNALTPAHPIVQWLCDTILSYGDPTPEWDRSIYLLKDERAVGTIYVSDDTGLMSKPKISEILDMLEEYLEAPP